MTGDDVVEGRHIDLVDDGWQQATGTTLAVADSGSGGEQRRMTEEDKGNGGSGGNKRKAAGKRKTGGC